MKRIGLLLAVVALGLAACAGPEAQGVVDQGPIFSDPSQTIIVMARERFTIALPGNATTGYLWQNDPPYNGDYFMLVGTDYQASNTDAVGAPGLSTWTFYARRPGATELKFNYLRPWETGVAPADSKKFKVIIE